MRKSILTLNFVILLAGAALGSVTASADGTVGGTAMYRERIALPPGAVLEVTLEDVSRAGAKAEVLGRVTIEDPGSPPFDFEITFDPAAIDERFSYVIRARITVEGTLMFTTDQFYPALTRGAGTEVDLMLHQIGQRQKPKAITPESLRGTFVGDLPSGSGEGIRYRLDLFADNAFFLRMSYLGETENAEHDTTGSWSIGSDDRTLVLHGGREAANLFRIVNKDTLRKLDLKGHDIVSDLNYNLVRTSGLPPFEPQLLMRGMYSYMADAALFKECLMGRRMPVAFEGDNVALERAYLKAQRRPGEELLIEVEGHIAQRPAMEGDETVESLVVDRFIGVWPRETCGARMATVPLRNTYWRMTRLGDRTVSVSDGQREPHLLLRMDGRITGFSGCNQLMGAYNAGKTSIDIGPPSMTRMACPQGMEQEQALTTALEAATTWKIEGEHLELLDDEGQILVRCQAIYLR